MSIAKNTAYNLVGSFVPIILALAVIPFYLNLVGTERYGALAIAWLILGYFGLFDLGFGRATTQRIAALKDGSSQERSDIFWTAIGVNIGMGAIGGVILFVGANAYFKDYFNISENLRIEMLDAIPYLAASMPIATLTSVASGALQGRERFAEVNIATILSTSLFQLMPLAVAWAVGPTLKWLIIAAVSARIIGLLFYFALVYRHMLAGYKWRFDNSQWKGLLKYGGWISITSAIGPFLVISDRFIIGNVLTAVAVTIYTLPFEMVQRMSLLPRSIGMALFPRIAAVEEEEGRRLAKRATTILLLIMTPVMLFLLFIMRPFLDIWIGADRAILSAPIGWALIFGYWINALTVIPYSRLQAIGRPDLVSLTLLIQLPFYLVGLYFALQHFGLMGAAAVFSFRCLVDYLMLNWLCFKELRPSGNVIIYGSIILINMCMLFYHETFSVFWFASFILSMMIIAAINIRNMPVELKKYFDKFLPAALVKNMRFK